MPAVKVFTVEELKKVVVTDGIDGFELDEVQRGYFMLRNTKRAQEIVANRKASKKKKSETPVEPETPIELETQEESETPVEPERTTE